MLFIYVHEIIAELIEKANSLGTVKLAAVWMTSSFTIFACEQWHIVQYLSAFVCIRQGPMWHEEDR